MQHFAKFKKKIVERNESHLFFYIVAMVSTYNLFTYN